MNELKPSEYVERLYQNIKMNWNQGAAAERERIIKLLELEIARHFELGLEASAYYLEGLVALIKRRAEVSTNNSDKNDAIEERDRVINMLELSTRDRNLHDSSALDCFCDSCIQAESERLDWFISMKNPAEGQLRGIRTMIIGEDDSETGLVWGWELLPEEGEPALFTGGQWVSLMPLMEGKNND